MPTKTSPERPGRIYVLCDPRSGEIRYLGITTLTVARRFSMHKSSVTGGKKSEIYEWMAALRTEGLEPIPHLVEDDVTDPMREMYWIALLHDVGVALLNMDHGGTGKGKKLAAEHVRKMSLGHIGIKRTLASRLKQVRSRNRGRNQGAARVVNTGDEAMGAPSQPRPRPTPIREESGWEDVEPASTDLARVDSPITGSVLGQNFSRIRELAQRIAAHDEIRALSVIEGEKS